MKPATAFGILAGFLFCLVVSAQSVPRPVPRPAPKPAGPPPRVNPAPQAPLRRGENRRTRQRRLEKSEPKKKPATTGSPGFGTAGRSPRAGAGASTAGAKRALRRLRMRQTLLRSARTESWEGEVRVTLDRGRSWSSRIKVDIQRSRDGSLAQRFFWERPGDLPGASLLMRLPVKEPAGCWRFRPEERRVTPITMNEAVLDSALHFKDLLSLDPVALKARFVEEKVVGKKKVLVFRIPSTGRLGGQALDIHLRQDNYLISRMEWLGADEKVKRQVLFLEPKSHGVQKRWSRIVAYDLERGIRTTMIIRKVHINPGLTPLHFKPESLAVKSGK